MARPGPSRGSEGSVCVVSTLVSEALAGEAFAESVAVEEARTVRRVGGKHSCSSRLTSSTPIPPLVAVRIAIQAVGRVWRPGICR